MNLSPTLRAIQAEAAPHMARCGKLTVHCTWHDRVFGSHTRPEFDDVAVPRVRRADPHAARAGKFPMVLWRNPRRLWRLSYYDNWDRLVTVFGDPNIRETLAQYAVRQGEARP